MATRRNTVNREWLDEKFKNLEDKLDLQYQTLQGHIQQDQQNFDQLGQQLNGHNIRVDRLEQTEQRRTWHLRSLWSLTIGGLVTLIVSWLK